MSHECNRHARCCPPPVAYKPFKAKPYLRPPRKRGPLPRAPNTSWNWSLQSCEGLGTPLAECTPTSPIPNLYSSSGSICSGRSDRLASPEGSTPSSLSSSLNPSLYCSSGSIHSGRSDRLAEPLGESIASWCRPSPEFASRRVDRRRSLGYSSPIRKAADRSVHSWPSSVCPRPLQSAEDLMEDCTFSEFLPPRGSSPYQSAESFSENTLDRCFVDDQPSEHSTSWSVDAYDFDRIDFPYKRLPPEGTAVESLEDTMAGCVRRLFKRRR